jgi:outer membrane protein OmpA-like peptidoglycan-associated protein
LSNGFFDSLGIVRDLYVSFDDVLVKEISEDDATKLSELESICLSEGDNMVIPSIEFDVNSANIRSSSLPVLLKLVEALKSYRGINIEIQGHTDTDGNDEANLQLSENRSKSVADFIVQNGIDTSQIKSKGYGESQPIADNKTLEGRQKNRRVSMKVLELPNPKKAYQLAIEATRRNDFDKAFEFLRIVNIQKGIEIPILLDSDLTPLHKDKRWMKIRWFAKQRYLSQYYCEKKDLAFEWGIVWYEDQIPRTGNYYWQNIKPDSYLTEMDSIQRYKLMFEMGNKHIKQLEQILNKNGGKLPPRVAFGKKGFEAVFAVVQHSGDIVLMEKYLKHFKNIAEQEPIVNQDIAFLTDRLELLKGNPQVYGTQFTNQYGDGRLAKIIFPEKINERRKKMGLPPLDGEVLSNREK